LGVRYLSVSTRLGTTWNPKRKRNLEHLEHKKKTVSLEPGLSGWVFVCRYDESTMSEFHDFYIPNCIYCKHFSGYGMGRCAAFPKGKGIPRKIIYEDFNHRLPFPGDNGIQFDYRDDLTQGERTRVDRVWPRLG
jgi:hypothetical protein